MRVFCSLVLLIALSFQNDLCAQRHELGFSGGLTNYFGDLNRRLRISPEIGFGQFIYKSNRTKFISFGSSLSFAQFGFSDLGSISEWEQNRNASFHTQLFELSAFSEWCFFPMDKTGKTDFVTPYFKVGAGLSSYKVYDRKGPDKTLLTDLYTEGQVLTSEEPSTSTLFMLYGLGIKFGLGKYVSFGLECSWRKTASDYLDDISTYYPDEDEIRRVYGIAGENTLAFSNTTIDQSIDMQMRQRGNATKKDDYLFFGLFFTYTINNPKCPLVL